MVDRLFGALASNERRRLLAALESQGLGDQELAIPGPIESEQVWGTTRTQLYHVHLPKLVEAGIVEWDRTEQRIEKGPQFDHARRLLRAVGNDGGVAAD